MMPTDDVLSPVAVIRPNVSTVIMTSFWEDVRGNTSGEVLTTTDTIGGIERKEIEVNDCSTDKENGLEENRNRALRVEEDET